MQVTTLKGYLAEKHMTLNEFAEEVPISAQHLYKIMNGKAKASRVLTQHVKQLTDGIVDLSNPR